MNQNIHRKSGGFYSKLVSFFLFLTIVAILVVLHFALAKANIKLYNNLDTKEVSVLIEMQSEENQNVSPDAILGKIIITEFELSASVTSSEEMISSSKAGGYVTIYNNYSKNQPLVKTTRLLTPDDKLFRISEGVTVPAGGQVEVWAEADQEGEEFVTETTTFIIPGLWEGLQDKIYAESSDGMKMQSIPNFVVTEENIAAVQEQIKAQATQKSLDYVNELVGNNLAIDANRLKFEFGNSNGNQLGDISKETKLNQKVRVYALIFDKDELLKKAQDKFSKELKGDQTLVNFSQDSITYEILEINTNQQSAIIEVKTDVVISSSENVWDIDKSELVGLDESGLRNYFSQFDIEKVEIQFSPFWVRKAPHLKDHIIIE